MTPSLASHTIFCNRNRSRPILTRQPSLPDVTIYHSPDVRTTSVAGEDSTEFGHIPTPEHSSQRVSVSPAPVLEQANSHRDAVLRSQQQEAGGLGEVNRHTEGAEFYGPIGTFYFLSRLQSQANAQQARDGVRDSREQPSSGDVTRMSVVNLLHSSDYPISKSSTGIDTIDQSGTNRTPCIGADGRLLIGQSCLSPTRSR